MAGAGAPPRLTSLFRAELERARSRRSLPWLTVVAVVAVVGVATLMWFNTAHVTASDMAAASVSYVAEQQQYHDQCMADPSIPEAERVFACGQPASADDLGNAIWYLPHAPFSQSDLEGLLTFGGGVGMLVCLMLAATTGRCRLGRADHRAAAQLGAATDARAAGPTGRGRRGRGASSRCWWSASPWDWGH